MGTSTINEIGDRLEKYAKKNRKTKPKIKAIYMDETSLPIKSRLG